MREYVKIYCCGDCIHYDWKKHRCKLGAHEEGKPTDNFYRDCPMGIHKEDDVVKQEGGMMEELKRCPFCGGKAKLMKMGYPHWVYCENCGARIHGRVVGEVDGEKASIEAWNRRTE